MSNKKNDKEKEVKSKLNLDDDKDPIIEELNEEYIPDEELFVAFKPQKMKQKLLMKRKKKYRKTKMTM
ncbi:DNA gyrase subunit A [Mycoplasmopsis caviae]|uniref:DNA gyrase subunit A n=1 Tax=Mycoplasmopsis caviae TaxID=55603 RepID=A0A3P8KCI0_9BACT|nr:hypothetical protein [Mycoplasmopsis caviae]VDR42244.1 DNA gyrase subunit A [Mycoplasmopsis caviae]